jgi:hypothetical protein
MKTKLTIIALLFSLGVFAQSNSNFIAKWAPGALAAGKITVGGEYNFKHRKSVTLMVGIPNPRTYEVEYDANNSDVETKGYSVVAGYRYYLSKRQVSGFYIEPFAKYVDHEGSGILKGELVNEQADFDTKVSYKAYGVGAQLGVQFLVAKRFAIDLYLLGPEANIAKFRSTAKDISSIFPWTPQMAAEAKADIEEIVQDIPIIGDKAEVNVNSVTKTVSVDYDGFLPSLRAGISIGWRF